MYVRTCGLEKEATNTAFTLFTTGTSNLIRGDRHSTHLEGSYLATPSAVVGWSAVSIYASMYTHSAVWGHSPLIAGMHDVYSQLLQ